MRGHLTRDPLPVPTPLPVISTQDHSCPSLPRPSGGQWPAASTTTRCSRFRSSTIAKSSATSKHGVGAERRGGGPEGQPCSSSCPLLWVQKETRTCNLPWGRPSKTLPPASSCHLRSPPALSSIVGQAYPTLLLLSPVPSQLPVPFFKPSLYSRLDNSYPLEKLT